MECLPNKPFVRLPIQSKVHPKVHNANWPIDDWLRRFLGILRFRCRWVERTFFFFGEQSSVVLQPLVSFLCDVVVILLDDRYTDVNGLPNSIWFPFQDPVEGQQKSDYYVV
eukprot:scaffold12340_cov60-Cylindrotheca_fusiformis.AAC.1